MTLNVDKVKVINKKANSLQEKCQDFYYVI